MSNALVAAGQNATLSLLMDPVRFDHMQRVGKMLALSPLFPEHLRKGGIESAIANGVLICNIAARLREDELTVAQSIYFVGGKPGWSTSYMIGKANQHGVFRDPIDWEVTGKGDSLSVTAFAILKATGKRVQATCDMAMAKAEGWTKNAKYQSMPEHMLRYRSATFLIRLYCPEVMIGIPTQAEQEMPTLRDVSPEGAPVVEASKDAPIEGTAAPADPEPPKKTRHEIQKEYEAEQKRKAEEQRAAAKASADAKAAAEAARKPLGPTEDGMRSMLDLILAEIAQGADAQSIRTTYATPLGIMQAQFPALYQQVSAALAQPAASAPSEDRQAGGDLFGGRGGDDGDFLSTPFARQFLADVETVGTMEAESLYEAQLGNLRRTSPEAHAALMRKASDIEASA